MKLGSCLLLCRLGLIFCEYDLRLLFANSMLSKKLVQKHIVMMDGEMLMEVEVQGINKKSREKNAKPLYSDLEEARNRVRRVEKEIVESRCLSSKLEKKMNKANERYDSATIKLSLES
ncbi:unnamed protein product [Brassica rapa]|uniref:Uncharacterized protein n=1 Tax=Brassica campestris TaxID=3711 RepID=A0A8D9DER7_BRACM|nr:unnamed protein product [Brassica rapa]